MTAHQIPADIQDDLDEDEEATELPAGAADIPPRDPGHLPVYQPTSGSTEARLLPPSDQHRDPVEENLTDQPDERRVPPLSPPPAPTQPTDAIWNPDANMEPLPSHSEPPEQEAATEMEVAAPEDNAEAMCSLQMLAISIRVGAKAPSNLDKVGAPMDLYAPTSLAVPPLGASTFSCQPRRRYSYRQDRISSAKA